MTDLSGECGGILTEQTGEITSVDRDGDGYYDFNLECRWLIIAENGSLVELKFPHFRIEYDSTCFYDYVAVSERGSIRQRHTTLNQHVLSFFPRDVLDEILGLIDIE